MYINILILILFTIVIEFLISFLMSFYLLDLDRYSRSYEYLKLGVCLCRFSTARLGQ